MKNSKETGEKLCAFYANDYHFEMISLPYINSEMEKDREIIIMTENDLENTINILMKTMKLEEERKKQILKLNWKNNDLEKFKQLKEDIEEEKGVTIFIKGKENYIENIEKNIEKWIKKSKKIKVIDCYDIEEMEDKIERVVGEYSKILSTSGEKMQ